MSLKFERIDMEENAINDMLWWWIENESIMCVSLV
jgi:hypothetical protein